MNFQPSATKDFHDATGLTTSWPPYEAPSWLPGGQLQTIYAPFIITQTPKFIYRRERWEMPDYDFIDLDWLDHSADDSRLLVLLHGLEGCSRSHYAVNLMNELYDQDWHGVVAHARGCSGELNRLPRGYHAGDSAEIGWICTDSKSKSKGRLYVVGISMGGNYLLKWLGEQGTRASEVVDRQWWPLAPRTSRSLPRQLDYGWNKQIYTRNFLRTMKRKVSR